MAAPWLAILVKSVPWVELARRTPEIIEGSRRLLEKSRSVAESQSRSPRHATVEELTDRVRLLEQRDVEHAKVLEQVVAQLKGLTDALEVLETRNRRLSYLLVGLAVLVAIAAVAVLTTSS